jgi:hypothetical protein
MDEALSVAAGVLACTKVDEQAAPRRMPVSTNLENAPHTNLDTTKNTPRKTSGKPGNFKSRSVAHLNRKRKYLPKI